MFIVFDSNVWIKEIGLQSKNGAAVRSFVRRRNATVVIPEVVELEVRQHLASELLNTRSQIEKGYRALLPVIGKLQRPHLPSEDAILEAVDSRILDLDVLTRQIPLNADVARSSMMKLLQETPPSQSKEQFRDGVIWAHCVELTAEGDVYFVSADTSFYEQRKYEKGLARELEEEMSSLGGPGVVKLVRDLTELLRDIRVELDLSPDAVFDAVRQYGDREVDELLNQHGFELRGKLEGDVAYFATENAGEIYLRFDFSHACVDVTEAGRSAGTLYVKGFGFLDAESREVASVKLSNVRLDYPDWEPGGPGVGTVFASGHANAPMVHEVRAPLG